MKKSSEQDLIKRGKAVKKDISAFCLLTTEELFLKLNSSIPAERSAAVIALREKCNINDRKYVALLLECLSKEKALYTKMEICLSLEKGNGETALWMCNYLGKIGSNQHTTVPDAVSLKKSFPLPRDIIARTLSRMNESVFPALLHQLEVLERKQLSELLDVIGYMAFYNSKLATKDNFAVIVRLAGQYANDGLILWKIALCCSGFPLPESKRLLNSVKASAQHPTILAEVERSLRLIRV